MKARKEKKISQTELAKKIGVTQSRIAQIESGVGTSKITFDVLLNVLSVLGFDFKIHTRPAASLRKRRGALNPDLPLTCR